MKNTSPILGAWLQRGLLSLALLVAIIPSVQAQYFTEGFDDVSALWGNGWAQQNRSTSPGSEPNWVQGDPGIFVAHDGGDTSFVGVSYNCLGGTGTISNWLFTPTRTFTNGEKISFWTRTVNTPNYPDRMQFRLSLNGASTNVGATAASVGDFTTLLLQINPTLTTTGYPNVWTKYTVIISGLSGPTSGRAAFRYFVGNGGPSGINSEYIGVDSFAYFLPPAGDLELVSIHPMEYVMLPERHPFPGPFIATYHNFGSTTVTDAALRVNVYNGLGGQVYTASSTPHLALMPGDTVHDSVPAPASLAPDDYTIEYIVVHSAADGDHGNDTLRDHFTVSPLTYARDNGVMVGSIGIGAYVGGFVGQQFHLNQADNLDSIWVHVTKGYTGLPLAAVVWDMAAGIPQNIVGTTDTLTYATDSAASYVLPLHGGHLQLQAGDFVVTMIEFDSTLHVGLSAAVFTVGTTWLSWPTLPNADWRNVEFFGLAQYQHAQMIRVILAECDMTIATTMTPPSGLGAQDGAASVVASGGVPPYAYAWSTGDTGTSISNLGLGPVSVTVTDASGCTSTAVLDIMLGDQPPRQAMQFGAYPNPNDGNFRVFVRSAAPMDVSMRIVDVMGRLVVEEHVADVADFNRDVDLRGRGAGIYFVELNCGGVVRSLRIVVGE